MLAYIYGNGKTQKRPFNMQKNQSQSEILS